MNDIVISGKRIKRELRIFVSCIAVMELLNIFAIIRYDGRWVETVTNIGFVLTAAVVAYLLLTAVRVFVWLILKLFRKTK